VAYLVVGFDVELDLLASESSYSGSVSAYADCTWFLELQSRLVWETYLICMVIDVPMSQRTVGCDVR
jgi:hypothetical protein